jgi:hypothetical protein
MIIKLNFNISSSFQSRFIQGGYKLEILNTHFLVKNISSREAAETLKNIDLARDNRKIWVAK